MSAREPVCEGVRLALLPHAAPHTCGLIEPAVQAGQAEGRCDSPCAGNGSRAKAAQERADLAFSCSNRGEEQYNAKHGYQEGLTSTGGCAGADTANAEVSPADCPSSGCEEGMPRYCRMSSRAPHTWPDGGALIPATLTASAGTAQPCWLTQRLCPIHETSRKQHTTLLAQVCIAALGSARSALWGDAAGNMCACPSAHKGPCDGIMRRWRIKVAMMTAPTHPTPIHQLHPPPSARLQRRRGSCQHQGPPWHRRPSSRRGRQPPPSTRLQRGRANCQH